MRLVDTEIGFTGSAFDSGGLRSVYNEVGRQIAALNASKTASALEVGLAVTPPRENQLILAGKASASSPQQSGPVTKEVGPVDLRPLAWANLLRGRAMASSTAACTLGGDIGNGLAYVGDAQLLDTGQSQSTTSARPAAPQAPARTASGLPGPVGGLTKSTTNALSNVTPPASASQPAPRRATTTQTTAASVEGMRRPLLAIDARGGPRAVSQSFSRTALVSQRAADGRLLGSDFGIMSEVRQTIAPVTLFGGTANEITFEFLGEWVLRAVATGMPGGAYVHYGPDSASPETPVLRIIRAGKPDTILKLQDLFGEHGLVIAVPGLAEIAVGEDPRAIGGSDTSRPTVASNGTAAAAAVDVVRVRALPGATEIADVRIGHMETATQVPVGGVSCPIPVAKGSSATSVKVGDSYRQTFTVTNPYDCTLHNVAIRDAISTEKAARFAVTSTKRPATVATIGSDLLSGVVNWNNIGDIPPGGTRTTEATFVARGGTGVIKDKAVAVATLANCAQPGAAVAGVDVAATGIHMNGVSRPVAVDVRGVDVLAVAQNRELPRSGADIALLVAMALALVASGGAGLTLAARTRMR
jgi:hypothetical protein